MKPERQAESLVRVAQEGFNLRDQLPAHFLLCYRWQGPCYLSTPPIIIFLPVARARGKKNYNSKREDIEEEDQREDEGNVIL